MKLLETERLVLRWLTTDDAEFFLRLVNEPSFLRYIGDRGVRTLEDSRDNLLKGPIGMYQRHGFGLNRVEMKATGTPVGICGLIRRDTLPGVDLGFAFLPEFWSQGFAFESAAAVLSHGRRTLGMSRVLAIASPENQASAKLLGKLGFHFERSLQLTDGAAAVHLFSSDGPGETPVVAA